jgi:hypothetical protein
MQQLSRRLTAQFRRLFKPPLRRLAGLIDRRADVLMTSVLRRELALHDRERSLIFEDLRREVVRLQEQVDGVTTAVARHDEARVERDGQTDLVLHALLREVVRLQRFVDELLARHDQIEEQAGPVSTTIPIRERSA